MSERTLLEALVFDDPEFEQLEALLAEFNIFEAIGVVNQESRHSDFLAFLLDPTRNHGLEDIILKRFLVGVLRQADNPPLSPLEIDLLDLDQATVEREWRHIDILIRDFDNRFVCVVENKVVSEEHSDQLRHYSELAEQAFPDAKKVYIYLTPDGHSPSLDYYIPFRYDQIATILESVCQSFRSRLVSEVYTLIVHYIAMLRRHIVSESGIPDLCQRIYRRHKQALICCLNIDQICSLSWLNKSGDLLRNPRLKVWLLHLL
ncbi:MAG: PD-(D/E)XK nuclease family protein [Anaerolineae bacterium]|nr:PD-(D/E)XK nuclease family protein [Anaerolineae bacterium]